MKAGISIVFLFLATSAVAQLNELFAPFDCREHAELFFVEEADETITIDSSLLVAEIIETIIPPDTINGWKEWTYVENYTFGKNRGDMPMITELDALHPYFRDKIKELIRTCQTKGIELAVVETYRTHAKQHEYKTMGKKYTSSGAGRSKHQYGLAVDVVPIVDSVAVWDNVALWRKIGTAGEKLGLRWGGRWRKPYDPGHFEWTGGLASSQLSAGYLPAVPRADLTYPCIEEDLKLLKKYWKEWETSQSALTRK